MYMNISVEENLLRGFWKAHKGKHYGEEIIANMQMSNSQYQSLSSKGVPLPRCYGMQQEMWSQSGTYLYYLLWSTFW